VATAVPGSCLPPAHHPTSPLAGVTRSPPTAVAAPGMGAAVASAACCTAGMCRLGCYNVPYPQQQYGMDEFRVAPRTARPDKILGQILPPRVAALQTHGPVPQGLWQTRMPGAPSDGDCRHCTPRTFHTLVPQRLPGNGTYDNAFCTVLPAEQGGGFQVLRREDSLMFGTLAPGEVHCREPTAVISTYGDSVAIDGSHSETVRMERHFLDPMLVAHHIDAAAKASGAQAGCCSMLSRSLRRVLLDKDSRVQPLAVSL